MPTAGLAVGLVADGELSSPNTLTRTQPAPYHESMQVLRITGLLAFALFALGVRTSQAQSSSPQTVSAC